MVAVHGMLEAADGFVLILEYIPGGSLQAVFRAISAINATDGRRRLFHVRSTTFMRIGNCTWT